MNKWAIIFFAALVLSCSTGESKEQVAKRTERLVGTWVEHDLYHKGYSMDILSPELGDVLTFNADGTYSFVSLEYTPSGSRRDVVVERGTYRISSDAKSSFVVEMHSVPGGKTLKNWITGMFGSGIPNEDWSQEFPGSEMSKLRPQESFNFLGAPGKIDGSISDVPASQYMRFVGKLQDGWEQKLIDQRKNGN